MKLTVLNVDNWKPTATRQEILDRDGLYFVVQPSGVKSWALRYRRKNGGKAVKHTIGSYPAISLKAARSEATRLRAEIERGGDPHNEKVVAREQRANANDMFVELARRFVAEYQFRRNRSWIWSARLLGLVPDPDVPAAPKECPPLLVVRDGSLDPRGRRRLSLADRWGKRRLGDITDSDVIAVLDSISARTPILANRLHAVLHKLFDWARSKKLVTANPCGGIERPASEKSRDRVLEDKELRKVWLAADKLGHPYAGIVKLLILTGQRRNEIAGLRWSEVDIDESVLHLPAARTKNGLAHDVPLSAPAQAVISNLPRIVDADLVFTIKRQRVTGFSRAKERLDAASGVTDWTLHDLRRTVASGLQRLGVRLEVTEAVLNHKSGSTAGIVGVYQRHDYAEEKRDALARWADYVDALVSGTKTNVVALRGRS
jgi:integrase